MIAVKQKIATIQTEIAKWKLLNQELISASEELLPGTYFQLKYPDDPAAQKAAAEVTVTQMHLLDALSQVIPSISLEELRKYEDLRDKYSVI